MFSPDPQPICSEAHVSRVLVVDDDEAVRVVAEAILRADGHEVSTAADGEKALGLLADQPPPTIILLDLMMPVINGWEVLAAMAHRPRLARVPVLVLTGYDELEGLPEHCHVLHKPIEADVLRQRVRELEA